MSWDETLADDAIELWESVGTELDEWQRSDLRDWMAINDRGRWCHFEVGENVTRQNGKGTMLEVRETALLCGITGEMLGVHAAHEFKTSEEHFFRVQAFFDASE